MSERTSPVRRSRRGSAGLRADVLGRSDTIVMAVAGSAPAYSIAGSAASLIATVGFAGPAALLYCAIPMIGIAWAFNYLGRLDVNAGASYSWVARALHPSLGFMSGWALVMSATIFMVAGSLPAGSATLALVDPAQANNTALATTIGAAWFLVMLGIVIAGVTFTAKAQWVMTGVEVGIILVFGVIAVVRGGGAAKFSWSWFAINHFPHGMAGFAAGALVAAFFFWGWDVTSNLSEETKQSHRTSGVGGLIGVAVVFVIFELYAVAINMDLPADTVANNPGDVLSVLGDTVWHGPGGKILIVAVMLSTIATLETTLIQVSRTLFAMGRDRTIPSAFGNVHPRWQTPWVATLAVGGVALVLFVASNAVGSVGTIMGDAVQAIGLQIAVYYALAGIAVVVAYRKTLTHSVKNFVFIGVWPLAGALFMMWVFYEALPTLNTTTKSVGLGALALGFIPMVWYWRKGSSYYHPARLDASHAVALDLTYDGLDTELVSSSAGGLMTDL